MKKILYSFLSFLVVAQMSLVLPSAAVAQEETDTLRFVMRVRWGNVLDEPQDLSEMNFDGSISGSSDTTHVELIKAIRFERHDELTHKQNPVSWQSLTYCCWDGVIVAVIASSTDMITTTAGETVITKTAQELYDLAGPFIQDVGDGREIVIDTHRVPAHAVLAEIDWGKIPSVFCGDFCPAQDFSGSITLNDTTTGKLDFLRTISFEENEDSIDAETTTSLNWTSKIHVPKIHAPGGRDGMLVMFVKDRSEAATITFDFPEQDYESTHPLNDLFQKQRRVVEIKPGYTLRINLWRPTKAEITTSIRDSL